MDLHIEEYKAEDREAVLAGLVELQALEVTLSDTRVPSTHEGAEKYLEQLHTNVKENNGAFFCARMGDGLAGFLVCWIERGENINETADYTTYGFISDVFVFETYRKQGVFRELQAATEDYFKKFSDVRRVRVYALSNNEAAVRAYHALGFTDSELLMQKKIQ